MNSLPHRKLLQHDTPDWVKSGAVFFLTICCKFRGENELCREDRALRILEAVDFRQRLGRWYVYLFLLIPDHLHALVSFPDQENMRKVVSNFKENTAKQLGVKWHRDFFDHRLRNEEFFEEKAHYIRMNPVRKGLVEGVGDWPWVYEPMNGAPSGHALPQTDSKMNGGPSGAVLPQS